MKIREKMWVGVMLVILLIEFVGITWAAEIDRQYGKGLGELFFVVWYGTAPIVAGLYALYKNKTEITEVKTNG